MAALAKIIIASRESRLAMWQAVHVQGRLAALNPDSQVDILGMTTRGDQILDRPLAEIGGKGLFIKELEVAMQEGRAHLAVHSMKDVPMVMPDGFVLAAISARENPCDAFISNTYSGLDELPPGAVVGTSSLRREAVLRARYPQLVIKALRGNLDTRLKKLDAGEYDAIILASAGLKRLGFADRITDVLPAAMCLPAVGQGALAIETRADDAALRASLAFLQDEDTVRCARAERSFLRRVEGGCQVPVGVYASPEEAGLRVEAVIASLDGRRLYRDHLSGAWADAEALGKELADKLLAAGGLAIMHELGLLLDRK